VVVPGFANALVAKLLPRVMPRGALLSLIDARQRRRRT